MYSTKKELIKSLRDIADKIENTKKFYAYDKFVFIQLYIKCSTMLDKYVKKQGLQNDDKCIEL